MRKSSSQHNNSLTLALKKQSKSKKKFHKQEIYPFGKNLECKRKVELLINNKNARTFYFERHTSLKTVKKTIEDYIRESHLEQKQQIILQTVNNDYVFDYRFQLESGVIEKDISFNLQSKVALQGIEKYKICCCLAVGGFSKVFLVRSKKDGRFFAAKFIDKSKRELVNQVLLQNQKTISLQLKSPFLVKTHEFLQNEEFYVFIMDFCPGGELFYLLKKIKTMKQEQARIFFVQILLGIQHIHQAGFMYRDLKPENILLDDQGYVKIADFGLAKTNTKKSFSFCGSVQYMAPEIIRGKGHQNQVDFYCLGALLYEMLIGHPPFYQSNSTQDQSKARILFDNIQFPESIKLSQSVKDFITKLTEKNEKERLGYFGGCKQIMSHPWVGKINRKIYEDKLYFPPFPVDLSQLNFDPEEIGQSERKFEQKIKKVLSNSLSKKRKKHFVISKHKSKSQSSENKSKITSKNKSFAFSSIQRQKLSPYLNSIIKHSYSLKTLKTEILEQKRKILNKKYLDNRRNTQTVIVKEKQNKLFHEGSKLRKKCKYLLCNTTTDHNARQQFRQKSFEKKQKIRKFGSPKFNQNKIKF